MDSTEGTFGHMQPTCLQESHTIYLQHLDLPWHRSEVGFPTSLVLKAIHLLSQWPGYTKHRKKHKPVFNNGSYKQ